MPNATAAPINSAELNELTLNSIEDEANRVIRKPSKSTIWRAQFITIVQSHIRNKVRHPRLYLVFVAANLILALLVGFTWFRLPWTPQEANTRYKVITLQSLISTVFSNLGGFLVFKADRGERLPSALLHSVYPPASYDAIRLARLQRQHREYCWQFPPTVIWYGRLLAELPFKMVVTLVTTFIILPLCNIHGSTDGQVARFTLQLLALLLQTATNSSLGACTSALFANQQNGYYASVLVFSFNYLFGGTAYTPNRLSWVIRWIRYICPSYYVNQLLVAATFKNVTYEGYLITGNDILAKRGWLSTGYAMSFCGILILTIVFNTLGPIFLWYTTKVNGKSDVVGEGDVSREAHGE